MGILAKSKRRFVSLGPPRLSDAAAANVWVGDRQWESRELREPSPPRRRGPARACMGSANAPFDEYEYARPPPPPGDVGAVYLARAQEDEPPSVEEILDRCSAGCPNMTSTDRMRAFDAHVQRGCMTQEQADEWDMQASGRRLTWVHQVVA